MYSQEAVVNNQVGLHARPATFFIQKANEFKSSIWVEKDERKVNAKSLLGVLSLGIVKGTPIKLIASEARRVYHAGCQKHGDLCGQGQGVEKPGVPVFPGLRLSHGEDPGHGVPDRPL